MTLINIVQRILGSNHKDLYKIKEISLNNHIDFWEINKW